MELAVSPLRACLRTSGPFGARCVVDPVSGGVANKSQHLKLAVPPLRACLRTSGPFGARCVVDPVSGGVANKSQHLRVTLIPPPSSAPAQYPGTQWPRDLTPGIRRRSEQSLGVASSPQVRGARQRGSSQPEQSIRIFDDRRLLLADSVVYSKCSFDKRKDRQRTVG